MIKWKSKRFLALVLSGVMVAGNLQPINAKAEEVVETVVEAETTNEETAEAETTAAETNSTEESATETSAPEETTCENGTEAETEVLVEETTEAATEEIVEETTEAATEEIVEETAEVETEEEAATPTVDAVTINREISSNLLSNYNTGFESTDWWNDNSWAGWTDSFEQTSYGENTKPSENSGDYYLTVKQNVAQMCVKDIASILETETTYEYSYFAKLAEGEDSGTVTLQVASVSSGWDSQKAAEVTYDAEVVLNNSEWKQISGTFTIPAHSAHEQVKIQFVGSDGLSFCVDDLVVGGGVKAGVTYGDNLVKNPNFAETDLTNWTAGAGSATIATATATEAIFDDVTTYGTISGRKTSQECFAQEMTGLLTSGTTYEYSFWAMLDANDYADAPAAQREVCFAPYVIDADGEGTYWGSYSTGVLDSNCIKQLTPGEWTQFTGTFKPDFADDIQSLTIRILEQGTEYGSGDCVMGKYYVTGVSIREKVEPKKEIEWDIPDFKDTVSSETGLGTDCYTGTAIMVSELTDSSLMDLVEKHFNAVTFGNELKMDALFDYHDNNNSAPGFETVTWTRANGTVMTDYKVPTLDYSRAETMLKTIKEWNDANPDNIIKVRGHVLVWHSQAPEWFFRQDWDINNDYVSAEEMDIRQEWYIKTVLEHFVGENSEYKDMFYGWDVVNEAVSDYSGSYRTGDENSSWWNVYGNEDFIVNAFRYANHYAPATLELYYNDYNECSNSKVTGIANLLTTVKSHETDETLPTRITGMGMQGHHELYSPSADRIKSAAITYGNIVGKVQVTELDIKASSDFDGTDATLSSEYTKQAWRYKEIYEALKEVDAMENIDINGLTIWGVIDGNSWLQTSNSVGGASDGSQKQCPLLFDDDYKAKPAFYAFVDPNQLEPYTQNIVVIQENNGSDPYANSNVYTVPGADATFKAVWSANALKVKVTVMDAQADDTDKVNLYIDWAKSLTEGAQIEKKEGLRTAAQEIEGGYEVEFVVEKELAIATGFALDVVVTNGNSKFAFNDLKMTQDSSSKYFALATTKPYMNVNGGTVTIDGEIDSLWQEVPEVPLTITSGTPTATAVSKLLWDKDYLYVLTQVKDSVIDKTASQAHEQDSVEVFIDENNHKSDAYEEDDKQYRINYDNEKSFNGTKCIADNVVSATKLTDDGYLVEAAYKWTDITPAIGTAIGLELQINDGADGTRVGTASWYDESGMGWSSPGVFGTVTLVKEGLRIEKIADQTYTGKAIKPEIKVYEGDKLLTNKDYSVIYKNNVNAGTATVTVKGKGNYTDSDVATFTINQKDISSEDISVNDVYAIINNGTVKNPKVTVKFGKTKLKESTSTVQKDYTLEWPELTKDADGKIVEQSQKITITGCGNYKGTRTIAYDVLSKNAKFMSKVKVTPDVKTVDYFNPTMPKFELTYGSGSSKETLVLDTHYTIIYPASLVIGKNTVTFVAKQGSGFYGTKTFTINVTGKAISGRDITIDGIKSNYDYLGSEIKVGKDGLNTLVLTDTSRQTADGKATVLAEGTDYTLSYNKNTNAGTATVTITGKGGYSGKKNVKFKIDKIDLSNEAITITSDTSAVYTKTGAKAAVSVQYKGVKLTEKVDYTLSYRKNKNLGTDSATVKITGKGNFSGTSEKAFSVVASNKDNISFTVSDTLVPSKLSKLKPKMSVVEISTGKKLAANKDYEKTLEFYVADEKGELKAITEADLKSGTIVTARLTIKNDSLYDPNWEDDTAITMDTTFRLYSVKASSLSVDSIPDQPYTGKEIKPALVVKHGDKELKEYDPVTKTGDYIVAYSKNINVGKAKATITCVSNDLGGSKTVSFKIVKKNMKFNLADAIKSLFFK